MLYRLTGDRHPVHVDPAVAHDYGLDQPILHGLCTLGISARLAATTADAHPAEVRAVEARFAAPVVPGDELTVSAAPADDGAVLFDTTVAGRPVLTGGCARFA